MKYIDAELLRKEVKRLEKIAHKSALGCADSETRKFFDGKEFAYQHVGTLIDSLQQKPLIHTELCTLIACDVIQATAKRAIEKPQDKDKEEDLMVKKMEYLNMLEKSFFQQKQPDFPTTDEEIERLLATHPKVEVPQKYKTPDWLWKKQEQPEVDLEKAALHVYESWMGGTMDHVRRDMITLGTVLNARKEK